MPFVKKLSLMFALFATVAHADDAAWDTVQNILMNTQDIVVLDGTEKVPLRYGERVGMPPMVIGWCAICYPTRRL